MTVVADTGPINYLVLIGEPDVLYALYGGVLLPDAVRLELMNRAAPAAVREWISNPPTWVEIRAVEVPAGLDDLHPGERAAIRLAQEARAELLLLDEKRGRQAARQLGLPVLGTLGVLLDGAQRGLVSLPSSIERLKSTNFRISADVLRRILTQASGHEGYDSPP